MRDALAKKEASTTGQEAPADGAIGQVSQRLAGAFERLEAALKKKSEAHKQEITTLKQQGGEKEKQLRALVAESAKEIEKSIRSIDTVLG